MARLTILLALLAALLSRPQVTTCERELENVNLRPREQHLLQRIQRHQGEEEEEEENFFHRKDHRRSCCNQLRELRGFHCKCQAMRQIKENQLQGRSQVQQMDTELWNLFTSCAGLRSCAWDAT